MATLYIDEYSDMAAVTGVSGDGRMPIHGTLIANQKVTVAGSSNQSAVLNANTKFVTLWSDVNCQWEEGSNPTASATSRYLHAGVPWEGLVTAGNKIAVISQQ